MSTRERLTARDGSRAILAEIEALEKLVQADDAMDTELVQDAQAIADAEVDTVEDAADEPLVEEVAEQNDRAMDNWPATASDREAFARRLVGMAKKLMVTK